MTTPKALIARISAIRKADAEAASRKRAAAERRHAQAVERVSTREARERKPKDAEPSVDDLRAAMFPGREVSAIELRRRAIEEAADTDAADLDVEAMREHLKK